MNKISLRNALIVFVAAIAFSCSDDNDAPKGKYESGVFVLNEGGSAANGSVSFYNSSTSEVEQNILRLNSTSFVGLYPQSITFSGDKGYVIVGGDNRIEVVDANTFESTGTITASEIVSPRYLEVINNKAYISVWGPYDANYSLIDSYVLVYDLETSKVLKKIDTKEGTESLLYNGNYLFAANYNYGASNTVSVINPTDNTLVKEIEVSYGPTGMVIDANNKIWVACVGGYGATSGRLIRINPTTLAIEATVVVPGSLGTDIAVSDDKQSVLYTVDKSVFKLSIGSTTAATDPLFSATAASSIYAFNVNPSNGDIWIADPLAYSTPGKFFIYSSSGTIKASGDTGIAPGQIVFK